LRATHRHIPSLPEKILDAPELVDDFYLNLLDWSVDNIVAVALNRSVYLWHASSGNISKLMEVKEGEMVTSVSWVPLSTPHIAIGTSNPSSCVQLWDVNKQKRLRNFDDHSDRVGTLAWNKHILTSGRLVDGLVVLLFGSCVYLVMLLLCVFVFDVLYLIFWFYFIFISKLKYNISVLIKQS
jgi:WD40 repeat protein